MVSEKKNYLTVKELFGEGRITDQLSEAINNRKSIKIKFNPEDDELENALFYDAEDEILYVFTVDYCKPSLEVWKYFDEDKTFGILYELDEKK